MSFWTACFLTIWTLHYNSTKIRKQISSPTQQYEKISDIYFLCCVSLSDFIAIQPSILVFCSFFFKFPPLLFDCSSIYQFIHCIVYCCLFVYRVLCYLVLWPQDWINTTTSLAEENKPVHLHHTHKAEQKTEDKCDIPANTEMWLYNTLNGIIILVHK